MEISVIVPVYNVEDYLSECLDSLCSQWIEGMEIILVDDGSTDLSGEICDQYASNYQYISVIHQKNKGLGGARNSGTLAACGRYIAWIDSDDVVTSNWVETILNVIHNDAPDAIVYDFYRFGNGRRKNIVYGRNEGFVNKTLFLEDVVRDIRLQSFVWQKILRREFCEKALFVEDKLPLEDYEMIYRLLYSTTSIYYVPKQLYGYRVRKNSLIHGHNFKLTWHSYQLAIKRELEVDLRYKEAAAIARCIQAYAVCKRYIFEKCRKEYRNEFKDANQYIRKHFKLIITDKEVTLKWKLRFLFSTLLFFI